MDNPGNPIHDERRENNPKHSSLTISQRVAGTYRFGELSPYFAFECVPDDKLTINSFTKIQTYTLKSPLLSRINVRKSFINVPLDSVLPFQAERIVSNPNIGDDVPSDSMCVTSVNKITAYFNSFLSYLASEAVSIAESEGEDYEVQYNFASNCLRFLIQSEYFFSTGSLFATFKHSLSKYFIGSSDYLGKTFDYFFDNVASDLVDLNIPISKGSTSDKSVNLHHRMQWLRDNPSAEFTYDDDGTYVYWKKAKCASLAAKFAKISFKTLNNDVPFNYGRECAYQIACSHFFSNDKVDYIYSAELYRQNVKSCYSDIFVNGTGTYAEGDLNFTWNGIELKYDYLSGKYFDLMLSDLPSGDLFYLAGELFNLLFGFRRSLKYQDYFTGSKTRPLAVGDTSISVNNSAVSVVDVTKSIQLQKFLNSVNRAGRKFSNYMQSIFGTLPGYDFHDPKWLAEYSDPVNASEVENTGAAQQTLDVSVTSRLDSASGSKSIEFFSDRFGWIIGIQYFDIPRMYPNLIERVTMHKDRFDMFNPFMQFTGDQPIYFAELSPGDMSPFSYCGKYNEYKEAVDTCFGGFIDSLPSWVFKAPDYPENGTIGPDFIRSSNDELDPFYINNITSLALGHYFHFIELHDNNIDAKRPMIYQPQILG